MKTARALLLFTALIISPIFIHAQLDIVKVDGGEISGTKRINGDIAIYKGIPFAAPPLDELRWKAPQPLLPWKGVRACTTFSASPMQGKPVPFMVYTSEFLIPESPISEDCLYLNVWTGAKTANEKRAVLVWIYGGGFMTGGTAVPIYDGEALAKKGIVVVTINYRVGVFGFFAHPELSAENPQNASGNYGLLDQIAALKWVKNNIAAFGGDPEKVTIAGQSAGSMSVNSLVVSPLAKGLFHRAIGESGSNMASKAIGFNGELKTKETENKKMTEQLNLSINALRKMQPDSVMKKLKGWFTPVIDGYVIPEPHDALYAKGAYSDVPLLTGWNGDERFSSVTSLEEFKKQVNDKYGDDAKTVFKFYPIANETQAVDAQKNLGRDATFGISNYAWAKIHSKGKSKVFLYNFTRKPPAEGEYVQYASFHTAEVPYVFNTLKYFNRPLEPTDYELGRIVSDYWVNFIKYGDPNNKVLAPWPAFNEQDPQVMILDSKPQASSFPEKAKMEFLFNKLR